jgi:purine-binding chemotaxis protein CheW
VFSSWRLARRCAIDRNERPKISNRNQAGALAIVREVSPDPQLYDLVPFTAGERVFAVFADQVDSTAEAKLPAPLPQAPPAVLGLVCVRGRMLTVLDPVALVTGEPNSWPSVLPNVIALSGDEQLALAAGERLDTITISATDIQPPAPPDGEEDLSRVALGVARYGGQEITVLSVAHLFSAALRRRERRRRRF